MFKNYSMLLFKPGMAMWNKFVILNSFNSLQETWQ